MLQNLQKYTAKLENPKDFAFDVLNNEGTKAYPYDFIEMDGFRTIRTPPNAKPGDRFAVAPVCGNSLIHEGIFFLDLLVFKFTPSALQSQLCIWQTRFGITAKYHRKKGNIITLHNNKDWERSFPREEIKLLGKVIRVERDFR